MINDFTININGELVSLSEPKVMGILNVTPDSFYEESRVSSTSAAVAKAAQMISEGADILDIGGYSSRPGAEHISEEEESNRITPIVNAISKNFPNVIISIDTFRSYVAEKAVKAGAHMINDISGGDADENMFNTVKKLQVPYIIMHMKGTPQDMQKNPQYDNVTLEVYKNLSEKVNQLNLLGVNDVIVDPGFGFGKTQEHNFKLLNDLEYFHSLNCPLLIGVSRKSMIYKSLNISSVESLNGTTVLNTIATQKGAHILRVHDVKEAKEMLSLYSLMNLA